MRLICVIGVLFLGLASSGCSSEQRSSDAGARAGDTESRGVADTVADHFAGERFDEIEAMVTPEGRGVLSSSSLRDVWSRALSTSGAYETRGAPVVGSQDGSDLYDYPLTFERGPAHLQILVGRDLRVTGILLRPGEATGVWEP